MKERDGKKSGETDGEHLDRLLKRQLRDINARLIAKGHKPIKFRGVDLDDDDTRRADKEKDKRGDE